MRGIRKLIQVKPDIIIAQKFHIFRHGIERIERQQIIVEIRTVIPHPEFFKYGVHTLQHVAGGIVFFRRPGFRMIFHRHTRPLRRNVIQRAYIFVFLIAAVRRRYGYVLRFIVKKSYDFYRSVVPFGGKFFRRTFSHAVACGKQRAAYGIILFCGGIARFARAPVLIIHHRKANVFFIAVFFFHKFRRKFIRKRLNHFVEFVFVSTRRKTKLISARRIPFRMLRTVSFGI